MKRNLFLTLILICLSALPAAAQTSAFTYQGKLNNNSMPASGNYEFEFKLFDASTGGTQIGVTLSAIPATVTNGVFTVQLDFGPDVFGGGSRFLEIAVRQAGNPAYTTLAPRQSVTSAPYSIKALNAEIATTASNSLRLGGIQSANFVQTSDTRLSDERNPLSGSANYIQNGTSQQAASNFNVSGTGKADVFDAVTQFNLGGSRVLSIAGTGNMFVGTGTGQFNSTGGSNSFFGRNAGQKNTIGSNNSFFGELAGLNTISGSNNSFFGSGAANANITGNGNAVFGAFAGTNNTTGNFNTFIGYGADSSANNLTNATAIGAGATVGTSNTIVLGTNAETVQIPGGLNVSGSFGANILTAATQLNLGSQRILAATGFANTFAGLFSGASNQGNRNSFFGNSAGQLNTTGSDNTFAGYSAGLSNTTGANNAFFGANSGDSNTTGGNNSFFGRNAGNANSTASNNSFFGAESGGLNTTGTGNSFFGFQAGKSNTTANNNSFFGINAGLTNTTGASNSFFGSSSGLSNSTGLQNSFFGVSSGFSNSTGANNSFFGQQAGFNNSTGSNNSFFGRNAGNANAASDNSFFGASAGAGNTTGTRNSYFGRSAGMNNTTGNDNVFFGYQAGINTNATNSVNGSGNTFIGSFAGLQNTLGYENAFIGANAGKENTLGTQNTFIGVDSGNTNTTGGANTFIGNFAGTGLTTGSGNTFIGANSGVSGLNGGAISNSTAIGINAQVSTSNTIVLGTNQETVRIPGNLIVSGTVAKGGGSFRIDHPLDPQNKYLYHSFVESPDMMNIYNGNVTTDDKGVAVITLPAWFEALNKDFRYQLTVIGDFAQAIVLREVENNQFSIKTDKPGVKVSWQVTGIRHDKFAEENRIQVEVEKPENERRIIQP